MSGKTFSMIINGKQVRSATKLFDVVNPFDGKAFAQAPSCTKDELDQAVKAARDAFPAWASKSWAERQDAVRKCGEVLLKEKDKLSYLLTLEQGKGLPQAQMEILGSYAWMQTAAKFEDPTRVLSENDKVRVEQKYRPVGVAGLITAWNFPVILIHFKLAQALLAGCTVVLKPSEYTPLCSLEIARLYNEVLPPGVFNVVTSENKDLGRWLVEHPGIDKISFTGSTETGKHILRSAAGSLKKTTVELGGNDPAIVLEDADPQKVAPYLFRGAFGNSGQICMAIKRIYVHENNYESLCTAMAKEAEKAKFGNGTEKGVVYGPVNNEMQYTKVRQLLIDSLENGAEIVYGSVPPPAEKGKGYLFPPVILKNVKEGSRIVDEEQFGPVLPILSYKSADEAIERANATPFGLGGSVWTNNLELGEEIANQLQAGTTWVNDHGNIGSDAPFGGVKCSGIGHEGGQEGLSAFMNIHIVKVKKGPTKFSRI